MTTDRLENKIFWPPIAVIALLCLALRNRPRLRWPPHMIWFGAYLGLAGASVFWAFKPEVSFSRFGAEMMVLASVILPAMLASRAVDMMRGVFLCFALGSVLNCILILGGYSTESLADDVKIGYPGYFPYKGMLGEFASFAILFSAFELFRRTWWRALGLITIGSSVYLLFASRSKGALGCVLLATVTAKLMLFAGSKMRVSLSIVLLPVIICYVALSQMVGNLVNRISWYVFGNYTLTGRVDIWEFVDFEIAKRPLLGWGYRSVWLVGSDSPALVEAQGWVRKMPSAHNGYLDTILDTGYLGFVLFVVFIFATLNAIGRVADHDPARAWLLLSTALYVILINFLESGWMRGVDALWLMFVIVVAEAGRQQPLQRMGGARPVLRRSAIAGRQPVLAGARGTDGPPRPRGNCA